MVVLWMMGATRMSSQGLATPPQAPTFYKDVQPILQKSCESCHRPGQVGPFSMRTYQETRPWARAMKAAVSTRRMPPWLADPTYGHFNNDRSLSQTDIEAIVAWVDGGAREGDAKDASPAIEWPEGGFQIKPDVVVDIPAYDVPATGVIEWVRIAMPAPFKEDTWVTSVEFMPGAPEVVHHQCMALVKHTPTRPYNVFEWVEIPRDDNGVALRNVPANLRNATSNDVIVYYREVGGTEVKRRESGSLVQHGGNEFCYLPGLPYEDYRSMDAGSFVPAGSDITLSLHYTPNGLAVTDRSRLGFTVAKRRPSKRLLDQSRDDSSEVRDSVVSKSGIQQLKIPPYEPNYVAPKTVTTFTQDMELVFFRPHAHQRAKSVQYKLFYPDGREEIVLNVPRYDFNWQLTYRTSLKIPKGSRIETQFIYDNSTANRYNPDPSQTVYYGDQSWEEMGSANMGFLVPSETDERANARQR
jgi:hypothetical protein